MGQLITTTVTRSSTKTGRNIIRKCWEVEIIIKLHVVINKNAIVSRD